MAYSYSQDDKTNLGWFDKDNTKATLMAVEIAAGRLRGLENLKIQLRYPITAKDVLASFIQEALAATDHTEIYVMTQRLNLSPSAVESRLVRGAIRRSPAEMSTLTSFIAGFLA